MERIDGLDLGAAHDSQQGYIAERNPGFVKMASNWAQN